MEKQELELFRQGQFVIEDEEKEDATAPANSNPPEEKKVNIPKLLFDYFLYIIF